MCSQNAGNAISETQILKFSGACPRTPLVISWLWYSAHTFGDRILPSWGEGKENGPFGSFATKESLKNTLASCASPPQRLFILFIMFFGSLRIVLGVNRDRALDKIFFVFARVSFVQRPIAIDSENYQKRTEEHHK